MSETRQIVWAKVLAEAEQFTGGLAEYVSENSSRPGFRVVDENGEEVTVPAWARKLAIPEPTLKRWVQKHRSEGTKIVDKTPVGVRRVRSDFARAPAGVKAELVRDALQDSGVAEMVASDARAVAALSNVERKAEARRERSIGTAPGLAVYSALLTIRRDVKERLLPAAEQVGAGLNSDERESATEVLAQIRAGLDLAESLLTSGDWDSALAEILEA